MTNDYVTIQKYQEMDSEIIAYIKKNYFILKDFFQNHKYNKTIDYSKEQKRLLKQISKEFFSKYHSHPSVISDDRAKKYLEKYYFVAIKFQNGAFDFPRSFSRYLDQTGDPNHFPFEDIDLTDLDFFMERYQPDSLDSFLLGFFRIWKRIIIPLRSREFDILKTLADLEFLRQHADGRYRTTPPTYKDIIDALQYDAKQFRTVKRARTFLRKYFVCNTDFIILNSSKVGFYYAMIEIQNNQSLIGLEKYVLWKIPFNSSTLFVVCVPKGNIDELLDIHEYIPLNHWKWNVNLSQFDRKSHWGYFKNDLLADYVGKYRDWDLTTPIPDLNQHQIETLRNFSFSNHVSLSSANELSDETDTKSIHKLIEKWARNDVFQFYPRINQIGINCRVGIKLEIKQKDLLEKIVTGLLGNPVVDIFVNDELRTAIGSINIPYHYLTSFLDNIAMFRELYPEEVYEIQDLTKESTINRCQDLNQINFEMKDGLAYLIANN